MMMDRFWSKVIKTDSCWIWEAAKTQQGYGKFWSSDVGRHVLSHRLSKALSDGSDIDRSELCLHTCDNASCVRPEHLYWGSYSDNNLDSARRSGRKAGFSPSDRCKRGHKKTIGKQCGICRYMADVAKTWRRVAGEGREYRPTLHTERRLSALGLNLEDIRREFNIAT